MSSAHTCLAPHGQQEALHRDQFPPRRHLAVRWPCLGQRKLSAPCLQMAGASSAPELGRQALRSPSQQSPYTAWKPRTRSPNSRETDCRHALASWSFAMHGGQTARRLEHPQSTQERGLTIEALAHQAHVSAAWLTSTKEAGHVVTAMLASSTATQAIVSPLA